MKQTTFGIIGFGKMGRIRAEALIKIPDNNLKRIYDPEGADWYLFEKGKIKNSTLGEVLTDKDIDAVIICVPNYLVCDYVNKALLHGKHVFCEKPPGISSNEVISMAKCEKSSGKILMFGFNHRQHESVIHAKKLINSGVYGKILWMRGRYGKSVDQNFFDTWRSKKELAGGGILLDQGIHMLDLFLMFAGEFHSVKSEVSNQYWGLDIEDNVFAILKNKENGITASLHSTMTQWRHLFSLEIFLSHGYITINGLKTPSGSYGSEEMTIAKNRSNPPMAEWTKEESLSFPVDNSWVRELIIFNDCIINNKRPEVGSVFDALKVMELIERIYANGEE